MLPPSFLLLASSAFFMFSHLRFNYFTFCYNKRCCMRMTNERNTRASQALSQERKKPRAPPFGTAAALGDKPGAGTSRVRARVVAVVAAVVGCAAVAAAVCMCMMAMCRVAVTVSAVVVRARVCVCGGGGGGVGSTVGSAAATGTVRNWHHPLRHRRHAHAASVVLRPFLVGVAAAAAAAARLRSSAFLRKRPLREWCMFLNLRRWDRRSFTLALSPP